VTTAPQPPLSAAAEELLSALERSIESAGTTPGDPLQWLSSLIEENTEIISAVGTQSQLETLRAAISERGGGQVQPLTRAEVAAHAGERARKEGRPIVSSQDIVWAVLALVKERLSARGQAGVEADSPTPGLDTVDDPEDGPDSLETEPLPASIATEEMLESLLARLRVGAGEPAVVFRWLDMLLTHHGGLIGGEGGRSGLQELKERGDATEASGGPIPALSAHQLRATSADITRDAGRPIITPQDVAMAIVKLAAEAVVSGGAKPGMEAESATEAETPSDPPEEEPSEPAFEPAEGPDETWEFEVPADEPEDPDATFEIELPEVDLEIPDVDLVLEDGPEAPDPQSEGKPSDHSRTRTFRLFVSSTFQDLQAERNALQKIAFPRLRDFCARHNARFQAIDLRWGVSEEAGIDQQTMNICLGEIERCHQVTPKPNFLILLGDRYGWLPPPPQIPAQEFEEILERVDVPKEQERLERWYQKDLNADPPVYRLRPRSGERESYRDWAVWNPEEEGLRETLAKAVGEGGLDLPPTQRKIYQASATEQEVLAGALEVTEPEEKVFCFFRKIHDYPGDGEGNPQTGPDAFISSDPEDRERLQRLKLRLVDHLPASCILSQSVEWGERGPELTKDYLADLAEWVAESLEQAILRELEQPAEVSETGVRAPEALRSEPALSAEIREHLAFAEERRRFFVGREDILGEISDYIDGEATGPLAIVGEGGSGKSALMAEAARRIGQPATEEVFVVRFVGATPGSSEGRFLLEGLCREIALRYGADPGEIPTEYQELAPKLAEQMNMASQEQPLVLLVDSLDQLSDPALGLSWIPSPLPPHVRMVVSTRPEEVRDRLEHRGANFLELGPLPRENGEELLQAWLASARPSRRLQPHQRDAVLDAFAESDGNPLYLKLAAEEARQWPAWAAVGGDSPTDVPTKPLAKGVREIIRDNLLGRLAHDDNHGPVLVSRAVGYLAASRYGLAEDELIQVLSRDPDVYTWFLQETMHLPQDLVDRATAHWSGPLPEGDWEENGVPGQGDAATSRLQVLREDPERLRAFLTDELGLGGLQLPVVLWSRLFFDLEPYLTERPAEGGNLLSFYHRELGEVAAEQFLTDGAGEEIHGRLAEYFRSRADPGGAGAWDGEGVRGLSELPYHLTHAGRWDDVYETLTDFSFLEQKAARVGIVERTGAGGETETLYTGVFQLQDDFDRALQIMPGGEGEKRGAHPLIVTAVDFGEGLVVRCPWCNTMHSLIRDWLGEEISCPNDECGGPLKVNTFTVGETVHD